MVAAYLRIAPLVSTAIDPLALRELIYGNVVPADRVEHVRIRADPHGTDIFAFIDTRDPKEAADILHRLITKTIASSPQLRMWRIV
ncbi:hypothetical protein Rhe02_95820 [Rhizocola hellebori]|uniref:Uncharacterized protein n=1 Tax=Rhizocola hellebori TaxID=1392758 RepID=A0A8J3VM25_9ACTN|nr:hypothetical protein [Rhizocola hellebori]GIH11515.1 hypothetical protein Rhe02_95820 [Rhizocola hellebori]